MRPHWRPIYPAPPRHPVEHEVRRIVAERLGVSPDDLGSEVSLTDDLAADSLDLLEVAMILESRRRLGEVRTYGDLVAAVRACLDGESETRRAALDGLPVRWRVVRTKANGERSLEHADWLTPYTLEMIAEDAARAGWGSELEMLLPAGTDGRCASALREELAWLDARGISVRVRRDR